MSSVAPGMGPCLCRLRKPWGLKNTAWGCRDTWGLEKVQVRDSRHEAGRSSSAYSSLPNNLWKRQWGRISSTIS